jgi:hypothetical protein
MKNPVQQARNELLEAIEAYQSISNTAAAPELHEATQRIKALRAELADAICDGANPCPDCGGKPHGVMHDAHDGNGHEYEVGCLNCRDHRGMRSKSRVAAVAAWNDGPESWVTAKQE